MKKSYAIISGILVIASLLVVQSVHAANKQTNQEITKNLPISRLRERNTSFSQVSISTPSYPIGMRSGETKLILYSLDEIGNVPGEITSRTLQFYTQYDVPLSEPMGPFPTKISITALNTTVWNELVYLPKSVANKARSIKDYAIILKTTFTGVSSSGTPFRTQASLLLLLSPSSFSKSTPTNEAVIQSTDPSLQWNSSIGAIDYEYCFDTVNNNSCDTNWTGTYNTNAVLHGLSHGITYYWQVRANNMAGRTSANNGTWWSFTICTTGTSLITVTNTNDSGAGSLRKAIADVCPGGKINFHPSLAGQTILLSSTLLIDKDLTIDGSGLAARITLNGGHQHRILLSLSPARVIINKLGFSNAFATYGSAIHNTGTLTIKNSFFSDNAASNGGAIYNEGSLNLTDSIIHGNSATNQGGGIFNFANATLMVTNSTFDENSAFDGGGIFTTGSQTTITGSSFYNNSVLSMGGAIFIFPGTVRITNSSFLGNSASQGGGAIANSNGTLTVTNSTFSANTANIGGSIANGGMLNYSNTILANSISVSDCVSYGSIGTNVNNLVEKNGTSPNGCGTPALTSDPMLGSLAENGGPTQTMALLAGSPAINAGNDITCEAVDQRGVIRPQGSHCDIGAYEANGSINVSIGVSEVGTYYMIPSQSRRESYAGINNGPLKIVDTGNILITAAERVIYKVNNIPTSFSEMMALPDSQLDNTYWMPWYNNVDLDTQLRFGNVSNTPATVQVWIGGQEKTSGCTTTPANVPYPYILAVGASLRVSCPGLNNGPVQIVSNVNIVAAERVIYNVNGLPTSFTEMMGLPDSQLDNTYWMPWYNNVDLDTQLRFGNVSGTPAEVHVWIGGVEKTTGCTTTPANVPYPYVLAVGASLRLSCPGVNNGPVKIVSNVNIVAAERVIYNVNGLPTSFTEMMGLPDAQLDNTYWMPWYNNVDLDTQLRFGNVSGTPATVHVWIGTQEMTTGCNPSNVPYPYILAVGASLRVTCPGVNNGPVKIVSNVNIVAAERVIYKVNNLPTSFTEMMALSNSRLNSTYWLPWYNNVDLDTQLRFGVP
jgi:hypothetical protein